MTDQAVSPAPVTRSFIVIPARLASTRLPRKLLLSETGKPLIQHTYEAAQGARRPCGICVAADHQEIAEAVLSFGGVVRMTDPGATCGTQRLAEIAATMPDVDIFINVQGDEPELDPVAIDHVVELLNGDPGADLSTLATPIRQAADLHNPHCVKVVLDSLGRAMYFSRSPIPHPRAWDEAFLHTSPPNFLRHLGIYAYRRSALLEFSNLEPSYCERLESLEQLRALGHGMKIAVGVVEHFGAGIDTREDYDAFLLRHRRAVS